MEIIDPNVECLTCGASFDWNIDCTAPDGVHTFPNNRQSYQFRRNSDGDVLPVAPISLTLEDVQSAAQLLDVIARYRRLAILGDQAAALSDTHVATLRAAQVVLVSILDGASQRA